MVGPSADLITEWEGGSLGELVAILQTSAMPVRIEVIAPGTAGNAGEVHLLAGGLADAFAGSLRRDDAMAALQRLEGARFVVEARLPDPESGSLATPGPREGSLKDRPVAALMRYCEDYVLTCRIEVWRGPERAAISYRRGEIISTMVGGADGSERLPEVMGWTDGSYEIVLPAPVLPQTPARRGGTRATDPMGKGERRRHATLPMTPGSGHADAGAASSAPAAAPPARPAPTPPPVPATTGKPAQPGPATKPAPPAQAQAAKPATASPASTAARTSPAEAAPAPAAKPAAPSPASAAARTSPAGAAPAPAAKPAAPAPTPATAQPPAARPSGPAAPAEQAARPAGAPATTLRGPAAGKSGAAGAPGPSTGKPAPAAPQAAPAAPAAKVASRPAGPTGPANVPTAQAAPTQPSGTKPHARSLTPPMGSMAARSPIEQLAPEMTARGTPPVPAVPAVPARPAGHSTPPPITTAKALAAGSEQRSGKAEAGTPPVVPVPPAPAPFQLAQPAQARPTKPAAASNDLKPASGTIEAKSRGAKHLPPAAAPIEIADQPNPTPEVTPHQPINQVMIPSRPTTSRRTRVPHKGLGEHSVKVYILIGLAIGAGIVVAYWAYWYLPFFHH